MANNVIRAIIIVLCSTMGAYYLGWIGAMAACSGAMAVSYYFSDIDMSNPEE